MQCGIRREEEAHSCSRGLTRKFQVATNLSRSSAANHNRSLQPRSGRQFIRDCRTMFRRVGRGSDDDAPFVLHSRVLLLVAR
jgi:hypothetical protein